MLTLWWILDGGVNQRIFDPSAVAPSDKPKKDNSPYRSCGQYDPKDDAHDRAIKEYLQNLAQCINGENSVTIY